MSKIAFIFPGQGAQKAGMGKDFYEKSSVARRIFDQASQYLELDMSKLCFEKNDQLDITEYTQAAMVTTCLAIAREAMDRGLKPDVTAGLSLGEYCAIAVAGGFLDEDAIKLVRKRGILMQNTVPKGKGAMSAIMGMDGKDIEKVLEGIEGAFIANYNCPGQIVITGYTEAVLEAKDRLLQSGAKKAMMLNVSGPFHSPLLQEAGEELLKTLKTVSTMPLDIPYVTNVTGEYVEDIEETKELLVKQVASPVRWQQSVEKMIEEGVDSFVEIDPGRTLTGFLKKINGSVKRYNIGTVEEMEKVIQEIVG